MNNNSNSGKPTEVLNADIEYILENFLYSGPLHLFYLKRIYSDSRGKSVTDEGKTYRPCGENAYSLR